MILHNSHRDVHQPLGYCTGHHRVVGKSRPWGEQLEISILRLVKLIGWANDVTTDNSDNSFVLHSVRLIVYYWSSILSILDIIAICKSFVSFHTRKPTLFFLQSQLLNILILETTYLNSYNHSLNYLMRKTYFVAEGEISWCDDEVCELRSSYSSFYLLYDTRASNWIMESRFYIHESMKLGRKD